LPPVSSPEVASKIKRQAKAAIESELAKALEKLEIEESTGDELRRANLHLKRALQKGTAGMSQRG
jgi:L1 cell adhesion molecule like protein